MKVTASMGVTIPSECSEKRSFQLISVKQEQERRWDRTRSENRGKTEVSVDVIFILTCYIFSRACRAGKEWCTLLCAITK